MKKLALLALGLVFVSASALAQSSSSGSVVQTGKVTAKHMTMWATSGVTMDAGPAAGGLKGVNPTELGITNTGLPFCITDGPTSSPYHQLCLGANVSGFGTISFGAFQGATPLPFQCVINNTVIPNCLSSGGSGGVSTQGTVVANDIASFADGTGLLIKDSGFATSRLNVFTGDTGSGGTVGIVPAPPAGSAASGAFLSANGTFIVPAAAGPTTLTGVVTGVGTGTISTSFAANGVTNVVLAQMPTMTLKGNATGGTANVTDLTGTLATTILVPFSGDAGSGGVKGLVPAPSAGDAAAGKFLSAGGSFVVPAGTGGVTWPTSSNIVVSNGTNTPVGLAPVNNDLIYATGGVWAALASAANGVLVTSAGSVPSISSTLPSGLAIPAPVLSSTVTGTYTLGGTPSIAATALTGILSVPQGGTGAGTFTANVPILGNGTSAFTSGTRSGNTTSFGTTSGTLTSGHCVSIDANANLIDAGGACTTGGGGGTVNAGTAGQIAYYGTSSTIVSGNANLTISAGAVTHGIAGSVAGSLILAGSGSGAATISVAAAAGTPNFQLPITTGTTGTPLLAGTPQTWGTVTGNTTKFATSIGTITASDIASWDANGNIIDSGIMGNDIVRVGGTQSITGDKTFSGAATFTGTFGGSAVTAYLAAPAAIGGTTPAAGKFTTLQATGTLTTNVTGATQCLQVDASGNVSGIGSPCVGGSGVSWPTSGNIVVSNGTNTPASLAPVVNRLAVGTAGPVWGTLATANNSVLVTSAGGVPSLSATLPSGLTIPGFAPLASPAFTGVPIAPTAAQSANSTQLATTGFVKLQQMPQAIGWIAGQNPNNAPVFVVNQAMTIAAIVGRVEIANGSAATVTVNKAPSATACSSGTVLHSGSFNANGTAATNQTLTVTTTTLAVGDTVCLQTGGGSNWTSGNSVGGITVFVTPS